MQGGIARLHRALAQFMLDLQTGEHGYTESMCRTLSTPVHCKVLASCPSLRMTCSPLKRAGKKASLCPITKRCT